MSLNNMCCITVKETEDQELEEEFIACMEALIEEDEKDTFPCLNVCDKLIVIVNLEHFKIYKMIEFFKKHNVLVHYEFVTNIIEFLESDETYMKLYSEEHNKKILNNYIKEYTSLDDILDRLSVKGLAGLLPIEVEMLNQKI